MGDFVIEKEHVDKIRFGLSCN